jgi:hypothetical protein
MSESTTIQNMLSCSLQLNIIVLNPNRQAKSKHSISFRLAFSVSFSSTFLISTLNLKPISQVQDNHVISCNGYIDEQRNHETVSTVYLRVLALASAR